jgi:hypothetical protein
MKPLFISSLNQFAGKNLLVVGLGRKFQKEGYKVGVFKPVGLFPSRVGNVLTDEDILFFHKALALEDAPEDMCPVVMTDGLIEDILEDHADHFEQKVMEGYNRVAKDKDVVIIPGLGWIRSGYFVGIPMTDFIRKIDARVVTVDIPRFLDQSIDGMLSVQALVGENFLGAVFNRLQPGRLELCDTLVRRYLQKKNIDILGLIPDDTILSAVSVRELKNALNGEIVCCPEKQDELVERFGIGAMNVESALRYLRKMRNKAVIVGGDRSDIQLAALETSTKCLILTGDLYPDDLILGKAIATGVPILVVKGDTQSVVEKVEQMLGHISLRAESKVGRAVELVEQKVDFNAVCRGLGLSR